MQLRKLGFLCLLLLALAACGSTENAPPPTLSGVLPTDTAAPPPPPTNTVPPPAPPLIILLAAEGPDTLTANVQAVLVQAAAQTGMLFEQRTELSSAAWPENLRLVVALPPTSAVAELTAAAPQTQFVAIGIQDLSATTNLTVLAVDRDFSARQGFIAGYIAAVVTNDWRVGVLSAGNNVTWQSFVNGARFFCGLCRQQYPPFYEYPLAIVLPAAASEAEWRAGADQLLAQAVETVYVGPGPGSAAAAVYLMQAGVQVIGSGPRPAEADGLWLVSVQPDYLGQLITVLPVALAGSSAGNSGLALGLSEINSSVVTEGKQAHFYEIIAQLADGLIVPIDQ